uniref:Pkinase_Tyr domain-containing protein n=1 Tax=Angiostrongylus cantonensis TaxID=6313 RepID=A0A0K0DPD0_ANGCA
LIGKNNVAKISDFGLSCLGAQKKEKTLKKVFHDGMTPYDKFPSTAAVRKFVLAGNRLNNESDKYPEYLWNLTQACWKQDGADRPTFETIANIIESQMEDYNEVVGPFWKFW